MREHEVSAALAVATTHMEMEAVRGLAKQYPGIFYAACGVHPLSNDTEDDSEAALVQACGGDVLAVGETGLDFFRGQETEAMQRRRFAAHIAAARKLQKPLIIHTRDSQDAVLDMLRAENARDVGGVLHCFTGDAKQARAGLDINFVVSFSGIVTFKKSIAMRDVARLMPADGYLVETDSPYLAPVPYRGKTNTPAYVRYVAETIATVRGQTLAQTAAETSATFNRIFKKSVD
jgi:TatD DNase family protein